jgi:Ala-tRNA(Pro) deacylase
MNIDHSLLLYVACQRSGAKAMLLSIKPSNEFVLAVISAAAKMDSKAARKAIGCKTTRFATEEEVRTVTGCLPGAVPPFGSVWGIRSYMDTSLQARVLLVISCGVVSVRQAVRPHLKTTPP